MAEERQRREGGERKVFAGPRIRHLRTSLGLSQTAMARDLGISASYLNLVERNQRPLTTQLVLKLAAIYELDLKELHGDRESERVAELMEIFADPVFPKAPSAAVVADLVSGYPDITAALAALYNAYRKREATGEPASDSETAGGSRPDGRYPAEEVRTYFQARSNYVAALDLAAEAFHTSLSPGDDLYAALRAHLHDAHQIRVTVLPIHAIADSQRRYDRHNRRLFLSEMLPAPARTFQTAVHVALTSYAAEVDRLIAEASPSNADAEKLYRVAFANYFAMALMMPYGRFVEAAATVRHDLDILAGRFSASIDQVAHRLTTLQRSERRGIPFFFLRLDAAGNVLKRVAPGPFPFARFGIVCPQWRMTEAFARPGETIARHVSLPDGSRFLAMSRTIESFHGRDPQSARTIAITFGCDVSHAKAIVYGDRLDLGDPASATLAGISCRMCERAACPSRLAPTTAQTLRLDPSRKSFWPYEFA